MAENTWEMTEHAWEQYIDARYRKEVFEKLKERLSHVLSQYDLEADAEKLWRLGVYRVEDFPAALDLHAIEREGMCGSIEQYQRIYRKEMKRKPGFLAWPAVVEKRKVDMSADMQTKMAQCIFSEAVAMETFQVPPNCFERAFEAPGGNLRTVWQVPAHLEKAALVCKAWNQSYREYLGAGVGEVFQAVRDRAVDLALNMCDCDEYSERMFPPQYSRVVHAAYRGQERLFTVRFTRMGSRYHSVHELLAQYGAPEQRGVRTGTLPPVRIVELPRVCGISVRVIEDGELAAFRQWRGEQVAEMGEWLGARHDVYHKRPV
jgi:hypothetical protein